VTTLDKYDRLIQDAEFDVDGDAELGPYTLRRDDNFVNVYEWIDNQPVLQVTRKAAP